MNTKLQRASWTLVGPAYGNVCHNIEVEYIR